MPKKVSAEDRLEAQRLYAQGHPSRTISEMLEGRISASWISSTARADNWHKGLLPADLVSEAQPQIFESANATPEQMRANTEKLSEVHARKWQDHKAQLAVKLGTSAERILDQIFAPHVLKEVKTVALPDRGGQDLRMVEVLYDEPTPADKKNLALTLAILVDKASLLSGDATSRVETASMTPDQTKDRLKHYRDELAQRRATAEAKADNAAKKTG